MRTCLYCGGPVRERGARYCSTPCADDDEDRLRGLSGVVAQVEVVYVCGHAKKYDPPEDAFDAALFEAAAKGHCPDCQRLAAEINEHTARIRESRVKLQEALRDG